jgi:two-component system, response regulator YesN
MKILIVEDDIHTMDAILDSIQWQSIGVEETFTAYNVAQAKKILKNENIDIVVSDIEMSQGSGLDLLAWIRKQGKDTEFILLTCHEKFEYAASAIKFGVAEYLTKPYDADVLELTLNKTISKITTKRHLMDSSRYEEWILNKNQEEQLFFWLRLFSGNIKKEREWIRREIEGRKLPIEVDEKYHMVVTRITDFDHNLSDSERDQFIINLEKIQTDTLFNQSSNYRIVHRYSENSLWLLAAINNLSDSVLVQRCNTMVGLCSETYKIKATCCIGTSSNIERLPAKAVQLEKLIQQSALYYGLCFTEDEAVCSYSDESQVLDIEKLSELFKQRDKVGLLNYIKATLQRRIDNKTLTERYLYLVKQEILQSTYSFLLRAGIQATRLFYDENSITLLNNASQSAIDILRWANYLFERSFSYEEEIAKTGTMIQRINNYIHDHYQENIGRSELAEVFFLAPEYIGKLYRRKTGKNLNDYIGEYRIERAKALLRNPELRISDIAGAVGIDNFSYFSTLFKKYTGLSPNEYRKKGE